MDGQIFYICNCDRACAASTGCYQNKGECKYTTDPEKAKYGKIPEAGLKPKDFLERFEAETFVINQKGDKVTYYWEKEKIEDGDSEQAVTPDL